MSLFNKQPAMPTWHGTPPDLVAAFVEFVRTNGKTHLQKAKSRTQSQISDNEYYKDKALAAVKAQRQIVGEARGRIAELRAALADTAQLDRYTDGLIGLMYYPSLLGIRVDSRGRLVVHVRLFREQSDLSRQYVGDYEFSLHTGMLNSTEEQMTIVQTDISKYEERSMGYEASSRSYDEVRGYLYTHRPTFQPLLQQGDLVGMVDAARQMILNNGYSKHDLRLPEEPPEPSWTGITSGIELGLARTIEWSLNRIIRAQIVDKETAVTTAKEEAGRQADAVRKYNLKLTGQRAELAKIEKVLTEDGFDEAAARAQLHYITSLPGVMGVKFIDTDNGRVPVFHVRTSIVYEGERYDMGDYEVEFQPHPGSAAVVCVNQTRTGGRRGLYYHAGDMGSWYREDRHSWFCFGNRASDLRDLFERGTYSDFMHLAVNSLNSVNPGEQYLIPNYFDKIPMDAVWTPVAQTVRPRRRSRLTGLLL